MRRRGAAVDATGPADGRRKAAPARRSAAKTRAVGITAIVLLCELMVDVELIGLIERHP